MSDQDGSRDRLILPAPGLAGCLYGALLRDTRGRGLTGRALYNHFPASPMVTVTWVFQGDLHLVEAGRIRPGALARVSVSGPQPKPLTSWSPGEVLALSQAFKPEAWAALTGGQPGDWIRDRAGEQAGEWTGGAVALDRAVPPGPLRDALDAVAVPADLVGFETALLPLWRARRPDAGFGATGTRLADWARAVTMRAAVSGTGRSARQVQRRLRALTGHNRRELAVFAQVEDVWRLSRESNAPLAHLALDGGFADQSHMGRAVRRVTGHSPSALTRMIAEEEAFWAYRLLGDGL